MGTNMRMMLFVHMKMKWKKLIVTLHLLDAVSLSMSNMHFYMPHQTSSQHVIAVGLVAEK